MSQQKIISLLSCGAATVLQRPMHAPQTPWRAFTPGKLRPIAPPKSRRALKTLKAPSTLWKKNKSKSNLPSNSLVEPTHVSELARSLKHDVDLIYEWVHNNIEFHPIFGIQKGAFGAILDGYGTAMDQCILMVELLRESEYTADYVVGSITLNSAQVANLLGTDNSSATVPVTLMQQGGIPLTFSQNVDGSLESITFTHCWVRVVIEGTDYFFDPSIKQYTYKNGIDLAVATDYSQTSFLTNIQSGATVTADYVEDLNRSNMNADLTEASMNLVQYIQNNMPAATVQDVVGGRFINLVENPVRETSHPNQTPSTTPDVYNVDLPTSFSCLLEISMPGLLSTVTLDSRDISGRRLTLFWDELDQPILSLDSEVIATGTPATPDTWNPINVNVTHNAYFPNTANDVITTSSVYTRLQYVLHSAWGPTGRHSIEFHRNRINESKLDGLLDTDEPVLGGSMAVLAYTWSGEHTAKVKLFDAIAKSQTLMHHEVFLGQYNETIVTGLLTVVQPTYSLNSTATVASKASLVSSLLLGATESLAVKSVAGITAPTGTTLIDFANSNGLKVFDTTAANWTSDVRPNLTNYDTAALDFIENSYINNGYRVLLPEDGAISINAFEGYGFLAATSSSGFLSYIIDVKGSYGSEQVCPDVFRLHATKYGIEPLSVYYPGDVNYRSSDPVDLVTGNFTAQSSDLLVGSTEFPYSLGFSRLYCSGRRYTDPVGLGRGWTHNFDLTVSENSDAFLALGDDQAIPAASAISALYISLDLMVDQLTTSNVRLVAISMISEWLIAQLADNTVVVGLGDNTQTFVKLPDGSYKAPASVDLRLEKNIDDTFTATTPQGVTFNYSQSGKIVSQVFPFGITVNFEYDFSDRLIKVGNDFNRFIELAYDGDRMVSVSDHAERIVSFGYDVDGNLISSSNTLAKITTYSYDIPGRLTQMFLPANPTVPVVTNTYDSMDRVYLQTDALNHETEFFIAGSRTEQVDAAGHSSIKYFGNNGLVYRDINALGQEIRHEYDGLKRLVKTTMPEGNYNTLEYDLNGNTIANKSHPKPGSSLLPQETTFTFDGPFNKIKTATDPSGGVTTYSYDPVTGNLLLLERPEIGGLTPTQSFSYSNRGLILTKTDEMGAVIQYEHDEDTGDLLSTTIDAGVGRLNLTTSYAYDAVGNRVSTTDARGHTNLFEYDSERSVTKKTETSPFSYVSTFEYDDNGRQISRSAETGDVANPLQTITTEYTLTDKVLSITNASGDTTYHEYNTLDQLSKITDPEGRVLQFVYDDLGRLVESIDASTNTSATNTFTANGKHLTFKDANDNVTTNVYDGLDRLEKVVFPDSSYEQRYFDDGGNLSSLRNRAGQTTSFSYDELNRLKTKEPEGLPIQTSVYDLTGRLLKIQTPVVSGDPTNGEFEYIYDTAGRVKKQISPDGKIIEYELDDIGNLTKIVYPDGYYVEREFDELNRLTVIKLNGATTAAVEFVYDALSRRTLLSYENGCTVTSQYNVDDDLVEQTHAFASESLSIENDYSKLHQRINTHVSDSRYMWQPSVDKTTAYGAANELNQYPTVDANILSYNSAGCLESDGTWEFTYDSLNRLTSADKTGVSVSYRYDPMNRLVIRDNGSNSTHLIYDSSRCLAIYDSTTNTLQRRFVYGTDANEALVEIDSTGSKTFNHFDPTGSLIASVDESGTVLERNAFGPFGEAEDIATTFGFTGHIFEPETGLYYARSRHYSSQLGRFLQPDPVGEKGGLNQYCYVNNDPINAADSTGLGPDGGGWPGMTMGFAQRIGGRWIITTNGGILSWDQGTLSYSFHPYDINILGVNMSSWLIGNILEQTFGPGIRNLQDPMFDLAILMAAVGNLPAAAAIAAEGGAVTGFAATVAAPTIRYMGSNYTVARTLGTGTATLARPAGIRTLAANKAFGNGAEYIEKLRHARGVGTVSQVSFLDPVSGMIARVDHILRDLSGGFEVKAGLARLSTNQKHVYPAMEAGTAIPVGARAAELGLTPGLPLNQQELIKQLIIKVRRY